MNEKYFYISINNKAMPEEMFNDLCDSLSAKRHWCHDNRSVIDFNPENETPYWCSYPRNDQVLVDATYESVKCDAMNFCRKHGVDFDSMLEVKIVKVDL